MKRSWNWQSLLAFLVAAGWGGAVGAQDFSLTFSAPSALVGAEGGTASYSATGQLTTTGLAGDAPGAQGWSLSIGADGGGRITDATTAGTIVDSLFDGGFNKTELTTGAGNEGAVSAIVLSFTKAVTLPPTGTVDVIKLTVEATIGTCVPDDTGDPSCGTPVSSRVFFVNGRTGAGQPVDNKVTYDGETVIPTLGSATTSICPNCPKPLAFRMEVPGGTKGDDSGLVVPYQVDVPVGSGQVAVSTELRLESHLPPLPEPDPAFPANLGGAQGWSISLLAEPCFNIASATTAGTAADTVANGGFWDGGFNKTQVVDPAKNGGQQGAVSAIVLSFTNGNTLPPDGDFLVLKVGGAIDGSGASGPGVCTSPCTVRPTTPEEDGLIGAGQPVKTAVTVAGGTRNPSVQGVSIALCGATEARFVRGNANDDLKIDIADPIWTLNELFRGGPPTVCQDAADANDDGEVDASDAVYMITYLFGDFSGGGSGVAGPAPPAPFGSVPGACGADPTEDTLLCGESQSSC